MLSRIACAAALLVLMSPAPALACMPPMIDFDAGSARLDADANAELDRVASRFRADQGLILRLTAQTDPSGSAEANMRLARRRGEAVKAALMRRGVPASALLIEARGEWDPLITGPAEGQRVVVIDTVAAPAAVVAPGEGGSC